MKINYTLILLLSIIVPYSVLGLTLPWSKLILYGVFSMMLFQNRVDFRIPMSQKYIVFYVLLLLISYLYHLLDYNYSPNKRDFIAILSILEILLIYYVLRSVSFNREKVYKYVIQIGVLINVLAIAQFLDIFNLKSLLSSLYGSSNQDNWDLYFKYNPRAFSIFNNQPNILGLFNSFLIILLFFKGPELILHWVARLVNYALALLGLILSGSLTGLLSLAAGIGCYYFFFRSKKLPKFIILFIAISIGFYLVFPEVVELIIVRQKLSESIVPSSLLARINGVWLKSYEKFIESPILGIGPSVDSLKYAVDNEFFDKFLRYGLIGGVFFILFFLILLRNTWIKSKSASIQESINYKVSFILLIAFSLSLTTGSFLKSDKISYIFWLLYFLPFVKESANMNKIRSKHQSLIIITKNFPRLNNPANGVFIKDQAFALSKLHPGVKVYVCVELFKLQSKWPFVKLNKEIQVDKKIEGLEVKRILFIPFPSRTSLYYKSLALSLLLLTRRGEKDVYLINTVIPAGAAFSFLNIPYNLMTHGSDLRNFKVNLRIKKALIRAKKVFCVSPGLAEDVKLITGNTSNIEIIYNGLDFYNHSVKLNKSEIFTFIFVGALIEQKGINELIKAFQEIEVSASLKLKIIGDGILRSKIENIGASLAKNREIEFIGAINNQDVHQHMSESHVLVLPSYKEGFGRVVIEMFREGRPVIATKSGGPEYLINNNNGLVIEPKNVTALKNAMIKIYQNYDSYNPTQISNFAKENFDNTKLIRNLYNELKR